MNLFHINSKINTLVIISRDYYNFFMYFLKKLKLSRKRIFPTKMKKLLYYLYKVIVIVIVIIIVIVIVITQ